MVGFLLELGARVARAHRNRDNDLCGLLLPNCLNGGPHGGSGRQSVVNEYDLLIAELRRFTVTSIKLFAAFDFL